MKRPCIETGCPVLTRKTRCDEHERAKDKARGRRQERGLGADHVRLRTEWQRRMDAGEVVTCWRCLELGKPHAVDPQSWDLGHDDHDRSKYRGPECVSGNRATSGRISSMR